MTLMKGMIMLSKEELIDKAMDLPIEERVSVIDALIQSITPIDTEIDRKWIEVSRSRLEEMTSGKVKGIPGEEVFDRIWKRFGK